MGAAACAELAPLEEENGDTLLLSLDDASDNGEEGVNDLEETLVLSTTGCCCCCCGAFLFLSLLGALLDDMVLVMVVVVISSKEDEALLNLRDNDGLLLSVSADVDIIIMALPP